MHAIDRETVFIYAGFNEFQFEWEDHGKEPQGGTDSSGQERYDDLVLKSEDILTDACAAGLLSVGDRWCP